MDMWSDRDRLELAPLRGAPHPDESYQRLLNIVLSPGSPIYDLSVPQRKCRNNTPSTSGTTFSGASASSVARHDVQKTLVTNNNVQLQVGICFLVWRCGFWKPSSY